MSINFKEQKLRILVTGGAGFIGSHLVKNLLDNNNIEIFNLDKLSYASNIIQLEKINKKRNHHFIRADLSKLNQVEDAFLIAKPNIIFHLAAESHVDRSIDNAKPFIESNIIGTYNLLEVAKNYWLNLGKENKKNFRFLHISTDEVFGTLGIKGSFSEKTAYDPRSPYSASKAASDHLTSAWFHTYGLPIIRTNCSNNFGPFQFPEKLLPLIILKALNNKTIPVYGDGKNIRDWLFVEDHVEALILAACKGEVGSTYCIGGNNEKTNIEIVGLICKLLDEKIPRNNSYTDLIRFVDDRPGHDRRYAINSNFIKKELHWFPKYSFKDALNITVDWYLKNQSWCANISNQNIYNGERIGLFENNLIT